MRYIKKVLLIGACFTFSILIKDTVFAGIWERDVSGWKYQKDNGDYARDNWKEIDEKWYYFDVDGYMKTGWISSGDNWYYCGLNGSLEVNRWIGDYYVGENGSMLVNTVTPDGYEVGEDGLYINSGLSSAEISAFYQQKLKNWKRAFAKDGFYYDAQYVIRDIDQDGIDDLLFLHSGHKNCEGEQFSRAELYTIRNGKFILSDSVSNANIVSYYGFYPSIRDGSVLLSFSASRYSDYIYSITTSLQFLQEVYYTTHGDAGEYGEIYENANHIYAGYEYATDIESDKGEILETIDLNTI